VIRILPIAVILLLVGAAGAIQGVWTGRWSTDDVIAAAALRLSSIPMEAGNWNAKTEDMDPRQLQIACADGALFRQYADQRGNVVQMMLLCGRPGPISVHTPDVCFAGAGNEELGKADRFKIGGDSNDEFWVRSFRKVGPVAEKFRVFYGWSTSGNWEAPDNPRMSFANRPVLYKLYLVSNLREGTEAIDRDPALDLLRALRPQLRAAFSNSGGALTWQPIGKQAIRLE
jgi:uncharacterized protein DUF3485